jgi:hypothetical protein
MFRRTDPLPPRRPLLRRLSLLRALAGWLLPALLPCLLAALALGGVLRLGRAAHEGLRGADRYRLSFADIDCPTPPGLGRADFLTEVQYLAGWPDRFAGLDADLPARLRDAFAAHPWVAGVERVTLTHGRRLRVGLRFREPVLAVAVGGGWRAVDADGVLLPAAAPTDGLPRFEGEASPPRGPAGAPWGDEAVTAAARAAARPR